jgi:hypothetical protein
MNHAKTSFSREICAGAIISVVPYLAPLWYMLLVIMKDEKHSLGWKRWLFKTRMGADGAHGGFITSRAASAVGCKRRRATAQNIAVKCGEKGPLNLIVAPACLCERYVGFGCRAT